MSDFESWLRESCFQAPPLYAKELAQAAWTHQADEIARLTALLAERDGELEKARSDIQEMVAKAASKHRPAYDEQQRRIMSLEDRLAAAELDAGRRRKWNPSPADVAAVCEEVLCVPWEEVNSCDECKFCGMRYGNVAHYERRGERLPHEPDCIVLKAQDILTGIDTALESSGGG